MSFATWQLSFDDPHYGTGPEQTIADNGGHAEAIWSDGAVEAGATILGKYTGSLDGTDDWNCVEVTAEEAAAFITANFTPSDDITLEDALGVLN